MLLYHTDKHKHMPCHTDKTYGTYHIGDQRRLRRACASTQSHHSLRCSHTKSIEVDVGYQNQTSYPTGWLRMRVKRMNLRRTKSTIISWDGSLLLHAIKHTSHRPVVSQLVMQPQWTREDAKHLKFYEQQHNFSQVERSKMQVFVEKCLDAVSSWKELCVKLPLQTPIFIVKMGFEGGKVNNQ